MFFCWPVVLWSLPLIGGVALQVFDVVMPTFHDVTDITMLGTGQNPVFAVCLCFCLVTGSQKQWRIQDLARVLPKSAWKWKKLNRKGGRTPPGSADEKYDNISLLIQMHVTQHYHTIRITEKCSHWVYRLLSSPCFFSFRWTEYISKFLNLLNETEKQHSEIHDLMLLIPQARIKCIPTITSSFSYLTVLYVKDSCRTVYLQLSCFEVK